MNRVGSTVAVLLLLAAALALLPAGAQTSAAYGSKVKTGESDAALVARDAGSLSVCRGDYGNTGSMVDDTFYVVWGTGTTITTGTLRLTAFGSEPPGSVVGQSTGGESATLGTEQCDSSPLFCYADVDTNGSYSEGDYAYVTAGGSTEDCIVLPDTSTNPDSWTVRVTGTTDRDAGTLVLNGQTDHTAYGPADQNTVITGAEFVYWDSEGSQTPGSGDRFFLASKAVNTGDTVPVNSVRLSAASTSATTTSTTPTETTSTTPTLTSESSPVSPSTPTSTSPTASAEGSETSSDGPWFLYGLLIAVGLVGLVGLGLWLGSRRRGPP